MKKTSGIFTTIKVVQGQPLFLDYHLARLSRPNLEAKVKNFLREKKVQNTALRIDILEDGEILFSRRDLPQSGDIVSATGFVSGYTLPTTKQIDRTVYDKAQEYAKNKNADIAIFERNGYFLESTRSNLVGIDSYGNLITPSLRAEGLRGIARQTLLDKKILKEGEIKTTYEGPLVLINCLRVQGVKTFNTRELANPKELMDKIKDLI